MKLLSLLSLTALSLALHSETVRAPESVAYKRQAKLFYDRIEVGVEPVRVQRCKTPGTIWWDEKCFRPERIPRS